MKFDGCKVKQVIFEELKKYQRFFTDDGEGFSKEGNATCVDDYSLRPINIDPTSVVWIKE